MKNQHLDLFAFLAAPFHPEEVRVRPQGGRQLHYVTARTVMNRLDDVLGPANWWDEYSPLEHSVICKLTIRLPDGNTLTKSDAGGYAGMSDSGDDDKSGFSDAFKRAAVKFGVGRYLYRDGVPQFVRDRHPHHPPVNAEGEVAREQPPAGSDGSRSLPTAAEPTQAPAPSARLASENSGVPKTGKAFFAWTKQQDEKLGLGLLDAISDWAKEQDFPGRMIQWSEAQVSLAYAEASRRLDSLKEGAGTGGEESRSQNRRNGRRPA